MEPELRDPRRRSEPRGSARCLDAAVRQAASRTCACCSALASARRPSMPLALTGAGRALAGDESRRRSRWSTRWRRAAPELASRSDRPAQRSADPDDPRPCCSAPRRRPRATDMEAKPRAVLGDGDVVRLLLCHDALFAGGRHAWGAWVNCLPVGACERGAEACASSRSRAPRLELLNRRIPDRARTEPRPPGRGSSRRGT